VLATDKKLYQVCKVDVGLPSITVWTAVEYAWSVGAVYPPFFRQEFVRS
jgi:hypothetical protein